MCDFGVVSASQAARWFYKGSASRAEYRFRVLREAGMMRTSADSRWAGPVGWVTGKAASRFGVIEGLPGSEKAVVPAGGWPGDMLLHRLAATEMGLAYRAAGRVVVSERTARRVESMSSRAAQSFVENLPGVTHVAPEERIGERRRWLSAPVGIAGDRSHRPDLLTVAGGRLLPVEIELTVKTKKQWLEILRAWVNADEAFDRVLYLCTPKVSRVLLGYLDEASGRWVDGLAQEVGLLPADTGREPVTKGTRLLVQEFSVDEERIMYALDMRDVGVQPIAFHQWSKLRAMWLADADEGASAGVGWRTWWGAHRHEMSARSTRRRF